VKTTYPKPILTWSVFSLLLALPGGGKVGVSGQWLVDGIEGGDCDGHLARLEVKETSLIQDVPEVIWKERRQPRQLELGPPYIGGHLHQLVTLKNKALGVQYTLNLGEITDDVCTACRGQM
jgi:hypothetical protein